MKEGEALQKKDQVETESKRGKRPKTFQISFYFLFHFNSTFSDLYSPTSAALSNLKSCLTSGRLLITRSFLHIYLPLAFFLINFYEPLIYECEASFSSQQLPSCHVEPSTTFIHCSRRSIEIGSDGNTPLKTCYFLKTEPPISIHTATPERAGTVAKPSLQKEQLHANIFRYNSKSTISSSSRKRLFIPAFIFC